jgi:protein gp37
MNENKHSMNTRDKIERQKNYSRKRKAKKELSQNRNIKKSRNRLVNFTSLKQDLEMKKTADRVAINRRLRVLRTTSEYTNVFAKKKERMIQIIKNDVIIKR